MNRKLLGVVLAVWGVVACASPARAQDEAGKQDPSPRGMARSTRALLKELTGLEEADKPSDQQKEDLARCRKALQQLVDRFKEAREDLTLDHFVEVSSVMLEEQRGAECLAVAEAGLARFPESRFLLDHIGFAQTLIGVGLKPGARRLAALEAAEKAFRKALPLKPDTWHAHIGLAQALDLLDRPAEALVELAAGMRDAAGAKTIGRPWQLRAALLLRAGKHKDALAELQAAGSTAPTEDQTALRILTLRATVLAGDTKKAPELVTALLAADDSALATGAAADALLWLGKRDDAVKLLDKRPVGTAGAEGEEDRADAIRKQSHETLKVMARTSDWSPAGPLRGALVKSLGHAFVAMDMGKDGKPVKVDHSGSPVLMAHLVQGIPHESAKDWGNFILLALCLRAIDGYKPNESEKRIHTALSKRGLPRSDELPAVLMELRRMVGDPSAAGGLCARRAAEKLGEAKPADKKPAAGR